MIFSYESRQRVKAAEPAWVAKFVLRIITTVFAIVALGLGAVVWATGLGFVFMAIPLGASIIWNIANIIVRLSRARPMHPGANVALDLLIWIAFLVCLVFAYIVGVVYVISAADSDSYDSDYYSYYGDSGGYYDTYYSCGIYGGYGSYAADFCAALDQAGKLTLASDGVATVCLILHFTLFVWACVDTHRRNRMDDTMRVQAMAAGMLNQMQYNNAAGGGGVGQPVMVNPQYPSAYMQPGMVQPGTMQQQQPQPYMSGVPQGYPQQPPVAMTSGAGMGQAKSGGGGGSLSNAHTSYLGSTTTNTTDGPPQLQPLQHEHEHVSPISPPTHAASPPPQLGSPPPQPLNPTGPEVGYHDPNAGFQGLQQQQPHAYHGGNPSY